MKKTFYSLMALFLVAAGVFGPVASSKAENPDTHLMVGVSPFSPFVIASEDGRLSGFSIDLWKAVAAKLNKKYMFIKSVAMSGTLDDVVSTRVDVALGGIAITEDREKQIDFTHSYFHTGLGILVRKEHSLSFLTFLGSLLTPDKLAILGYLAVFMVFAGHFIWLVERRNDSTKTSFDRRYLPGVLEGMYWALVTASTVGYGDRVARSWPGRVLAVILIVVSLPMFAFFVAKLSSNITLHELRTSINGPQDLIERRVGVVAGATSEGYVQGVNCVVFPFERIGIAYQWLMRGEIDAVVFDRPNLQYYARNEGKGLVEVVGKTFSPQDYGMAIPHGSHLREELNRVLLGMIESGEMEELRARWFGREP